MILRGYRYRLRPTVDQEETFRSFAGVCRLVYNLGLEQRRDHWRQYERATGKRLNYVAQARELTALRAEFDWIAAVSQTCQQQALRDLDRAFVNFFQGREVTVRKLNAKWSAVRLPKVGEVRFRDTRPIEGTVKNVTVSLAADGWHVTFTCERAWCPLPRATAAVGIDRGVANTFALSTGERMSVPDSLATLERCKRKAQRVLARRKRGSRRYARQRSRIARLQARAARKRRHWLHERTTNIAERFSTVVIEALRIRNMTASARGTMAAPGTNVLAKSGLNRAILAQGWHIFEVLLAYKLEEWGGCLIKIDPAYTSQTCSACGTVDRLSRENQARFVCTACGHRDHADVNAAINILRRNAPSMPAEDTHRRSVEPGTRKLVV